VNIIFTKKEYKEKECPIDGQLEGNERTVVRKIGKAEMATHNLYPKL
jgi:hypothetical protein